MPLNPERIEAEAWASLYRLAAPDDAARCGIHLARVGSGVLMAASRVDVLFFNRVVGLGLDGPVTDAVLDEIVDTYAAAGVPRFFLQFPPARVSDDLAARLAGRGSRPYNNWVKLVRGVDAPPEVETDLRVEPCGLDQAETVARIAAPAFDWPEAVQPWLARLVEAAGWRVYLALDGDEAAAVGAFYVQGRVGYMALTVTLPEHRRRGAQSALLARGIRDATDLGCEMLVAETAEDLPERPSASLRNARRFGFEIAYVRPNYLFERPRR